MEVLPIGSTFWHRGLEWISDQMLRVVLSATTASPKSKPRVEGGELGHFLIGRPSSMEERVIRSPSLSI